MKYNVLADEKNKVKITELKSLLNNTILPENLHSSEVLEISKELDDLILEYYWETKNKSCTKF